MGTSGRDIPVVQKHGRAGYPGRREATIKAWSGDDFGTTTSFGSTLA